MARSVNLCNKNGCQKKIPLQSYLSRVPGNWITYSTYDKASLIQFSWPKSNF